MMADTIASYQTLGFTAFFLVLLYRASHVVRYYVKFFLFIITAALAATVFIPIMLFRPKDYRNGQMPAWIHRQLSKMFGLQWDIQGKDNIVQNSGCIVLLNHQSAVDGIALAEIWPLICNGTVIMKKENMYLGPIGLCSWLCGVVFVDRLNGEKARAAINKTVDVILSTKARLTFFPEGSRHRGDTLQPFKKGAFHVAIASQVPIQPVVVSSYYFLDDRKKFFDPGTSIIRILPAIPTAGLTKDDLDRLMDETWRTMDGMYKTISAEAAANAGCRKQISE